MNSKNAFRISDLLPLVRSEGGRICCNFKGVSAQPDHKVPIKVKGGLLRVAVPVQHPCRLASCCRHVSRKRRASARSDFEIMSARLASDREPNRVHYGGIARVGTQDALEINRVGLPETGVQHAGGRHAHAIAVVTEIVGQWRDEADLSTGLDDTDIAGWPSGPLRQID